MAVKIGSARSSFGNTKAGDQSGGKEVSTQDWYLHSKGWFVLRAKDASKRKLIAEAMQKACANNDIGYSQGSRNTLYNDVKASGFDPSKTTKAVNTDCSALVRVCCAYAGITAGDFITSSLKKVLMATGAFDCLTEDKYCKSSDYLMVGDILCTKTKGHTVVVLSDGRKAEYPAVDPTPASGDTLTVASGSWNVRSGPGTEYDVIGTVHGGDTVTLAESSGWKFVQANGVMGFISQKGIKG